MPETGEAERSSARVEHGDLEEAAQKSADVDDPCRCLDGAVTRRRRALDAQHLEDGRSGGLADEEVEEGSECGAESLRRLQGENGFEAGGWDSVLVRGERDGDWVQISISDMLWAEES